MHDDRRTYQRQAVIWDAALQMEGKRADCTVLNLSAGGAKVMIDRPEVTSKFVTLGIPQFGNFTGEVAWRHGHTIGIRFHEEPSQVAIALADALPKVAAKVS